MKTFVAITAATAVIVFSASRSLFAAASAVLICLTCLRLYSLLRSDIWLWKRGVQYRERVNSEARGWAPSDVALYNVYNEKKIGGTFFPFGIRAIVLQAAYRSAPTQLRQIIFWVGYRLWKYYYFAPLMSLATYAILTAHDKSMWTRVLLLALGYLLAIGTLTVAVEAALSYLTFGSWSLAYHRFDVAEQRGTAELSALMGGVITALTSNASAFAVIGLKFAGFTQLAHRSVLDTIGLSYYYTITAFTGNGDPGPTVSAAYWQVALIYIQAAAYLLIVISLLLDSLGSEPGIHLPWLRRRQSNDGSATSE